MQRGDLAYIVSRVLGVLVAIEAFRMLLALCVSLILVRSIGFEVAAIAGEIGYIVALFTMSGFLWFRADLLGGGAARAKVAVGNPGDLQRVAFSSIGLYFVVAGGAKLLDDLWWEVLAKNEYSTIAHPPSSHVNEVAMAVIGALLLLLNAARLGQR